MCIQWRTNGSPVAASDWARSHSWCGKIRSDPPPWRSIVLPSSRQRERRALDVPPRPARPPHRLPRGLVVRRRLPEHEVERVALVHVVDVAAPLGRIGQHGRLVVVADRSEAREAGHVEVHRPARLVGVAAVEHHPDEAADVGDGGRRPGPAVGGQHVERLHVPVEPGFLRRRQVEVVDAELASLGEQRVVDVGDVPDALGVVTAVAQPSLEHVVEQVHRCVPDVGRVVRRDAARVQRHDGTGFERDDRLSGGVEQAHRHAGRRSGLVRRAAQALIPVSFGATRVR